MDAGREWLDFFARWPASVARKGILVTNFGEQVAFNGFLLSERLLLVERQTPDTVGARKVIVPMAHVQAVKITDVVTTSAFEELGFRGSLGA